MDTTVSLAAETIRQRILASGAPRGVPDGQKRPEVPRTGVGRQHYRFPLLLAAISAGVDAVALVGPAGTGKTTAALNVARMLGRRFEATSFGPTTSKADLFGLIDANGVYRDTQLVRAARDGAVFLGDELDAGHPGVITGLNMVLANPVFGTPAGMIEKHPEFVPVFGMNTYGRGATREYCGRNQIDAASMDRMAVIDWDLDEGLEAHMCGVPGIPSRPFDVSKGGTLPPAKWLERVWTVREAIAQLGVRHLVTPRCSQNGCRLFKAGVGRTWVEDMVLWKGMDLDTRERVEAKCLEIGRTV